MGNFNPGRFRKEGREAFEPGVDSDLVNPYLEKKNFYAEFNSNHWKEGWDEAKEAHKFESEETTEEYMVMATYNDELSQEEAGEITLRTIISCHDMPIELEIDGVVYKPQF